MRLKFRNPKFNIFYKIAFTFLDKMATLWSSEIIIWEQVKVLVELWSFVSMF